MISFHLKTSLLATRRNSSWALMSSIDDALHVDGSDPYQVPVLKGVLPVGELKMLPFPTYLCGGSKMTKLKARSLKGRYSHRARTSGGILSPGSQSMKIT